MLVTKGDKVFKAFTVTVVVLLALSCLMPFLYIMSVSFSSKGAVLRGEVFLWPVDFDLSAYTAVFNNYSLVRSMWFTIFLTIIYTLVCLVMTILCAYPLSKQDLYFKKPILLFILFTMYFSGGMIPEYLNIKSLSLLDTFWVLVLPGCLSTYNMIILKSFFQAMTPSLEEAARIDGASERQVLTLIILPLSKAALATIALFYAVSRWNGFMDSLLYVNRSDMYTIQYRLRQLIQENRATALIEDIPEQKENIIAETVKAGCLVFSMIPVILVYPWLQKYFVKGVMIGSVKG